MPTGRSSGESRLSRLFTAIEAQEKPYSSALRSGLPGANWESHPHVTISHFGEVRPDARGEIQEALAEVTFASFTLTPKALGIFGERDAPAVVWVGFEHSEPLSSLFAQLNEIRSAFNETPDRHEFNPHLTLARTSACAPEDVLSYVDRHANLVLEPILVEAFSLFESIDLEYHRIDRFSAER